MSNKLQHSADSPDVLLSAPPTNGIRKCSSVSIQEEERPRSISFTRSLKSIKLNKPQKKIVFDSPQKNPEFADFEQKKNLSFQLQTILHDRDLCYIFLQWLQQQHCDENLWFYMEVELFKNPRETPDDELFSYCDDILKRYIGDNADLQLNLDDDVIRELIQKKEAGLIDRHFFDLPQAHIFKVSYFFLLLSFSFYSNLFFTL